MKQQKNILIVLISVMVTFFTMGFVDLVGIATNYVKADFDLSDTLANLLPSMVFFWFLVFSIPTSILMNKIGRRKTVLCSLGVTILALLVPIIDYSFTLMLISFSLLGIGNTLMQVSLNPLLSNIVSGKKLASSLTFGQFVKAIASFIAPIIAAWGATKYGDWKILFPIFMVIAIIATGLLGLTKIEEQKEKQASSTFLQCFALLGDNLILMFFIGIICHVGIDVGSNVTAPKILMERLSLPLEDASFSTSIYFLFRTIGCLTGAFLLAILPAKRIFIVSVTLMIIAVIGLFLFDTITPIYVCIALIGLGNSNIFSIILSQALQYRPDKQNEISGLMIMGLFGGTIFPILMGLLSDSLKSQVGAVIVLAIGILYLFLIISKVKVRI